MPRYLRWISAITTGIVANILFNIVYLAVLTRGGDREVSGAPVVFGSFFAGVLNVIVALAISDWLSSRYPVDKESPAARRPY